MFVADGLRVMISFCVVCEWLVFAIRKLRCEIGRPSSQNNRDGDVDWPSLQYLDYC